jgi:hypothetical protein
MATVRAVFPLPRISPEELAVSKVSIHWYPEAPADAEAWRAALWRDLGPVFVALDRHGEPWRVAQAHVGDGDDLREQVHRVLREAGLPVE